MKTINISKSYTSSVKKNTKSIGDMMLRFGKSLGPLNRKVTEIKVLRDTDPEPLARKSKKKFIARKKAYFNLFGFI